MSYEQKLYDGITAVSAVKVPFSLTPMDFLNGVIPQLRIGGTLAAGDDINLWTKVDGAWVDNGSVLDEATFTVDLKGVGDYAITCSAMAAAGPINVSLFTANPNRG